MLKLSAGLLVAACMFGQGTTPNTGDWNAVSVGGPPVMSFGYIRSYVDPVRKLYCMRGGYHSSIALFYEDEQSIVCYSYVENKWILMMRGGEIHSDHGGQHGHTDQLIDYIPSLDSAVYQTDGSESIDIDQQYRHFWLTDLSGLSTRDIEMRDGQWLYGGTTSEAVWCPNVSKLLHWEPQQASFFFWDPATDVETAKSTTGATFPSGLASAGIAYAIDPNDGKGKVWFFGGNGTHAIYSVDPTTSPLTVKQWCTGGTCSGTVPTGRYAPGWAYSTTDHLFLMTGGANSNSGPTVYSDTWTFDPTANSGDGGWTQLSPTHTIAQNSATPVWETLQYDPDDNIFLCFTGNSGSAFTEGTWGNYPTRVFIFPLSASTGNYGRSIVTRLPTSGSINLINPTTTDTSNCSSSGSVCQSWARGHQIIASGNTIYASWIESGAQFDSSNAGIGQHAFVSSTSDLVNYTGLPTGSGAPNTQFSKMANRALALYPDVASMGATTYAFPAVVNGTVWEIYDKTSANGTSSCTGGNFCPDQAYAYQWNGTVWSGGAIGCFSGSCVAGGSGYQQFPTGLTGIGTTPFAVVMETNGALYIRETYVRVASWNGSSWNAVGGILNLGAAGAACNSIPGTICSRAGLSSITSDGTNPTSAVVCWNEEQNTNARYANLSLTPQIYCKQWNGTTWVQIGGSQINPTPSPNGYASDPNVLYVQGNYYVAFTERASLSANSKLYVCQLLASSCPILSGATININSSTGWAAHPQMATDGFNLYVSWDEQSSLNQHDLGYVKMWTGSYFKQIGGAIAADTANGSIEGMTIAVTSGGYPTVMWGEMKFGTLRQTYAARWTGSAWQAANNGYSLSVPLTIQQELPSGTVGVAFGNAPFTMGVPIPDAAGLTTVNTLGLTSASAGQFSVEASWPDGNIKWLKVRGIVASVSQGGTTSVTVTNSGSGAFGGSNLATDNGTTITVSTKGGTCGSGTAVCFTFKKLNFDGIDSVQIGSATLVSSGASKGVSVLGPSSFSGTASYTCSPTSGGSACTTLYSSSNDATNSTCSIEENGPAVAVVKCTSDMNDGASHVYMHQTTRFYMCQGSATVKATVVSRNADNGSSGTFATASKGYQALEFRLAMNLSGTLTYTIANHTGTPTTGTLNSGGGTDYAYIYQAESNNMKYSGWCTGFSGCNGAPSPISGYAIVNNGTAVQTGSASQYPAGWADISDSGGNGVLIGQEFFSGYGNKSLEFRSGGTDVRIGMWAAENNTTSPSTVGGTNVPYYQAWPQYSIHNIWLEFHTAAPSYDNDFLSFQYPLIGRAAKTWYDGASVFPYPMLDPTEETNWYNSAFSSASPSVPNRSPFDLPLGNTGNADEVCNTVVCIFRWWPWATGGIDNQMDYRQAWIYNWIRRSYPGGYLNAANWYKWLAESGQPMSDGFTWANQAATQYYDFPTATSANASHTISSGLNLWVQDDFEHDHSQGFDNYYLMSGDETMKDAYVNGYQAVILNTISSNNFAHSNAPGASLSALWNDRSAGNLLKRSAREYTFLNSIGDSTDATTALTNGQTVYTVRLQPDFCAYAGYPTGCSPDSQNSLSLRQIGTSTVRGESYVWGDTSVNLLSACNGIIPGGQTVRTGKSFMTGIKVEGMLEFWKVVPTSWTYYNQLFDYIYGSTQWAFGEMYADDLSQSWTNNGFRYAQAIDYPNSCNSGGGGDFSVENEDAIWPLFTATSLYLGQSPSRKQTQMNFLLQRNSNIGPTVTTEMFMDTIGNAIYYFLHPSSTALQTVPLTGFTDNGGGSYTIQWTVPSGATSYRVKWGTKQIVDWIGFDASAYSFTGNPVTNQNWFASTDATGIPTPATPGTTQSMTVTTGQTGLGSANFMLKAFASVTPSVATKPNYISSGVTH